MFTEPGDLGSSDPYQKMRKQEIQINNVNVHCKPSIPSTNGGDETSPDPRHLVIDIPLDPLSFPLDSSLNRPFPMVLCTST